MFKKTRQAKALHRDGPRIKAQLAPDDTVVVDPPEPFLHEALAGAGDGSFEAAATMLAETRRAQRWADRSHAVEQLAQHASVTPGWLEAWQQAQPDNPDQLVVRAARMIIGAWEVRGRAVSSMTSHEQFRGFHALLEDVTPVLLAAMDQAPDDPEPWAQALVQARGLQWPVEEFNGVLNRLADTDRDHFGGHRAALMYLTPKWFGSREAMFQFAEQASADRPPTSRLHTLPLIAFIEYVLDPSDEERTAWAGYRGGAVERAHAWIEAVGKSDPVGVAETRNMLAWCSLIEKQFGPTHEMFVAIGARAASYPWSYFGDPRERFLFFRDNAATLFASG